MFTNEEEILLEQYFPYENMDLEERDYYLNLLLHTKDIGDSDTLEKNPTFDIVTMSLKKTPDYITFNGAVANNEENRLVDGIIVKKGNSYTIISNIYRFNEFLDDEDKDYSVTDKFTFKGDKLYRKTIYRSGKYFEMEYDAFSLDPIEKLKNEKTALMMGKSKK